MRMKKLIAFLGTLSISSLGLLVPLSSAQAVAFCEGGECEVVFNKTERFETFSVPDGVTELEFEVYGGQGGAGGGRGGFVSGTLVNLPSELTIVVGGAGVRGANQDGGYNGGGFSGGRDGNPGSGGGASDIRIGSALSDRIVVAGGGGGYGGPVGGSGGAGGGETAADGSAGQGGAGAGGSQVSGGAGGRSNSGNTNGASGRLGVGGEGGYTFSGYGGGGGGAGYFGGGGGGADTDTCCLDAGGGGGGSSYANANYTSGVTFQPGFQAGDGKIILRYSLPASITEFSYLQTSPDSADVTLTFDSAVSGVEQEDFAVEGCTDKSLTGELDSYILTLTGCQSLAEVIIGSNSFGPSNSPSTQQSLTVELDQVSPSISFTAPETSNQSEFSLTVETDSSGIFDTSAISSEQCQLSSTIEQNLLTLNATECLEGESSVIFQPELLFDSIGNQSLTEPKTISVFVDTIAPVIEVLESEIGEIEIDGSKLIRTSTPVTFSESELQLNDFIFEGSVGCEITSEQNDNQITLMTQGCEEGEVSWKLPVGSLVDLAGNSAPAEDMQIILQIPSITPDPAPEPTPEPEQIPISSPAPVFIPSPEPEPTPSPEPVVEPIEESAEQIESEQPQGVEEVEDQSESLEPTPEAQQISEQAPAQTEVSQPESNVGQDTPTEIAEEVKPESSEPLTAVEESPKPSEFEQAIPVSQIQDSSREPESVNPWAVTIASILVLGLLVGVLVLTKNNRSRAID